jgi:phosphatidate cytidylyltransferase
VLKIRVYTSLAMVAVIAAVLFLLPAWCGAGLLAFILLIGAWEWAAFAGCHGTLARCGYVATTVVLAYVTARGLSLGNVPQLLWVAAGWWFMAGVRLVYAPDRVSTGMTLVAGWLTLLPALVAVIRLFIGANRYPGATLFLILVGLVAAADIGAYFAGRQFGRVKLAPHVSPGKTWEGVIGGALSVTVVAYVVAGYCQFPRMAFVGLAGVVFVASVVGDLTESLFKRGAGLKDSGFVLPGHGGILDRIDGLVAAAPFYVLGLGWMGVLQ